MIGFIGLGVMGEPICRHLASKSGKPVMAYDTKRPPLDRLKEHGVQAASGVREVAEKCDTVFLSLPGGPEVKEVTVVGLAICRAIVRLHGGRAWAEQLAGGGTAFRFTLPIEEPPAVPAEAATA